MRRTRFPCLDAPPIPLLRQWILTAELISSEYTASLAPVSLYETCWLGIQRFPLRFFYFEKPSQPRGASRTTMLERRRASSANESQEPARHRKVPSRECIACCEAVEGTARTMSGLRKEASPEFSLKERAFSRSCIGRIILPARFQSWSNNLQEQWVDTGIEDRCL